MDKDFHTIRTEFKEPNPKYSFSVYYDIRVKDSIATISGKERNSNFLIGNSNLLFDIENQKSGIDKYSFAAMDDFAKSLNGTITYTKQ